MAQVVKNPPEMQETWVGKIWRRAWLPTPVFLPGEFHGQRSLMGCSPWGHKESDQTERLTHTHTHTHTAALQCCVSFRCTMKWISNMHTYMPSLPTTHHPIHLGHHRALTWAPSTIYQIPIAICVTHGCGHTAIPTHPIPLPHPMSTHPFLMSASLFLPCK